MCEMFPSRYFCCVNENSLNKIFDDYDARANFVGFFDKLYELDRKQSPELYEDVEVAREQPLP